MIRPPIDKAIEVWPGRFGIVKVLRDYRTENIGILVLYVEDAVMGGYRPLIRWGGGSTISWHHNLEFVRELTPAEVAELAADQLLYTDPWASLHWHVMAQSLKLGPKVSTFWGPPAHESP